MNLTGVKDMTTVERLEAMELLWDALCHQTEEVQSPTWHEPILKKRKERIESGEAEFYTLDQLKERLRR